LGTDEENLLPSLNTHNVTSPVSIRHISHHGKTVLPHIVDFSIKSRSHRAKRGALPALKPSTARDTYKARDLAKRKAVKLKHQGPQGVHFKITTKQNRVVEPNVKLHIRRSKFVAYHIEKQFKRDVLGRLALQYGGNARQQRMTEKFQLLPTTVENKPQKKERMLTPKVDVTLRNRRKRLGKDATLPDRPVKRVYENEYVKTLKVWKRFGTLPPWHVQEKQYSKKESRVLQDVFYEHLDIVQSTSRQEVLIMLKRANKDIENPGYDTDEEADAELDRIFGPEGDAGTKFWGNKLKDMGVIALYPEYQSVPLKEVRKTGKISYTVTKRVIIETDLIRSGVEENPGPVCPHAGKGLRKDGVFYSENVPRCRQCLYAVIRQGDVFQHPPQSEEPDTVHIKIQVGDAVLDTPVKPRDKFERFFKQTGVIYYRGLAISRHQMRYFKDGDVYKLVPDSYTPERDEGEVHKYKCRFCAAPFELTVRHEAWFLERGLQIPTHCQTCINNSHFCADPAQDEEYAEDDLYGGETQFNEVPDDWFELMSASCDPESHDDTCTVPGTSPTMDSPTTATTTTTTTTQTTPSVTPPITTTSQVNLSAPTLSEDVTVGASTQTDPVPSAPPMSVGDGAPQLKFIPLRSLRLDGTGHVYAPPPVPPPLPPRPPRSPPPHTNNNRRPATVPAGMPILDGIRFTKDQLKFLLLNAQGMPARIKKRVDCMLPFDGENRLIQNRQVDLEESHLRVETVKFDYLPQLPEEMWLWPTYVQQYMKGLWNGTKLILLSAASAVVAAVCDAAAYTLTALGQPVLAAVAHSVSLAAGVGTVVSAALSAKRVAATVFQPAQELVYVPHVVSALALDFPHSATKEDITTNFRPKFRRLARLPIPDFDATAALLGTERICTEYFQDQHLNAFRASPLCPSTFTPSTPGFLPSVTALARSLYLGPRIIPPLQSTFAHTRVMLVVSIIAVFLLVGFLESHLFLLTVMTLKQLFMHLIHVSIVSHPLVASVPHLQHTSVSGVLAMCMNWFRSHFLNGWTQHITQNLENLSSFELMTASSAVHPL